MSSLVLGFIITAGAMVLAVGGLLVFRRLVPSDVLAENHEVAAAMLACLGTLYAIVLGLVVVEALNRRATAELQESIEASNLINIANLCRHGDPDFRLSVLKSELLYTDLVVHEEWPLLAKGTAPDMKAARALSDLWGVVAAYEPKTMREQDIHSQLLNCLLHVGEARRHRIILSHSGLPPLLWSILIVGGCCTIAFTYLFAPRHVKLQVVMTGVITLVFCLNLLLVLFYSRPYYGDTQILPLNFKRSLVGLRHTPNFLDKISPNGNSDNRGDNGQDDKNGGEEVQ